ncbi:MAG: LysO family transporter [Firmicutes bacterium]|nr:LysO family transporter [Bacillota bacterium]
MFLITAALILGFSAARLDFLPEFIKQNMKPISSAALFLLLFSMGLSLGSSSEIMTALPVLGAKAFLLALAAIAGSTLLVWAAVRVTAGK